MVFFPPLTLEKAKKHCNRAGGLFSPLADPSSFASKFKFVIDEETRNYRNLAALLSGNLIPRRLYQPKHIRNDDTLRVLGFICLISMCILFVLFVAISIMLFVKNRVESHHKRRKKKAHMELLGEEKPY